MNILHPLSRVFVALIFLISGAGKIFDFAGTAGYMESKGFFWAPLFLVGAIVFELVGGFSLLLGLKTRLGLILLMIFLFLATVIFHLPNIAERPEMIATLKNIAIFGALIKFYIDGPGEFSVDGGSRDSIE